MNHDELFKQLLQTGSILRAFFEQFLPHLAAFIDFQSMQFVDKERLTIHGRKRTGDLLVKTRFKERDAAFLIHLEHQAQRDPDLPKRMLEYFILDWLSFDLPVYPIVVLSHPNRRATRWSPLELEFPNKIILRFDFDIVDLTSLDAEAFLKLKNLAALALAARMRFNPQNPVELAYDFFLSLAAARAHKSEKQMVAGFFSAYLPLGQNESLQLQTKLDKVKPGKLREKVMKLTNPFIDLGFNDGIAKGMAQGIEKGLAQGIEKGIEKGRREGESNLVLRLLERRFGILPASQKKLIAKLDLPKLEALGESLLEFKSRADLSAWLKKHAS